MIKISASRLIRLLTCSQQYDYYYEQRIRPLYQSANMGFGKAIHLAFTEYIKEISVGKYVDPWSLFQEEWERYLKQGMLFRSSFTRKDFENFAHVLCKQLPDFWSKQRLQPIYDVNGNPLIEQVMEFNLTKDIVVVMVIDFALMHEDSEQVVILDLKSAQQKHDPNFGRLSQQLGIYQLGFETLKPGLFDKVDALGFWDLLKRKRDIKISDFSLYKPRSKNQLEQLKQALIYACEQIESKRFFQQPGHAFSSPCKMCDYVKLCCDEESIDLYQLSQSSRKSAAA